MLVNPTQVRDLLGHPVVLRKSFGSIGLAIDEAKQVPDLSRSYWLSLFNPLVPVNEVLRK